MPPLPIRRAIRMFLSRGWHNKRRVLKTVNECQAVSRHAGVYHTRSKAAIFLLLAVCSFFSGTVSGSYLPTRSVAGVSSFGARSVHIVFSFGFWDVGVKKVATADSVQRRRISAIIQARKS